MRTYCFTAQSILKILFTGYAKHYTQCLANMDGRPFTGWICVQRKKNKTDTSLRGWPVVWWSFACTGCSEMMSMLVFNIVEQLDIEENITKLVDWIGRPRHKEELFCRPDMKSSSTPDMKTNTWLIDLTWKQTRHLTWKTNILLIDCEAVPGRVWKWSVCVFTCHTVCTSTSCEYVYCV